MVVLPPSHRRPVSTLMPVRFQDLWEVLEGARSTRRDVIDPSIRSRSMDPGLAAWGLPASEEVSITTWGTILLLFLLIVVSVRTMVSTRTSRRRRAALLRDTEGAGVYICQGRQRRVRATLKIGVDLGGSSDDPIVSHISFQTLSVVTDQQSSRIFVNSRLSTSRHLHPITPQSHMQIPTLTYFRHRLLLQPRMDDSMSVPGRIATRISISPSL